MQDEWIFPLCYYAKYGERTKWYLVIQYNETQTDGLKKLLNVCTSAVSLPWLQSVMEQIGLSAPNAGVCLNR